MIRASQIPDEVVEAAAITLMSRLMVSPQDALHVWLGMYEPEKDQFRREARAAIAAALSAWPNTTTTSWFENGVRKAVLNIPLPQENANAEG